LNIKAGDTYSDLGLQKSQASACSCAKYLWILSMGLSSCHP